MREEGNNTKKDAKKRFFRFFGSCICLASLALLGLYGCGFGQRESGGAQEAAEEEEYEEIVMTLQTLDSSVLDGLSEVTEAVNAISIPEIGVKVSFRTVDATEAYSEYPLWLSNGESIDLMILNYIDVTSYINKGMAQPLDELLEKAGEGILALKDEGYDLTAGSVVDGVTYGVLSRNYEGQGAGLWIEKSYLDEVGFDFDAEKIYTMEELDALFALLKEKYPNRYPLGQITSQNTYSTASMYIDVGDSLGGDTFSGVILEDNSYRLENLYESEAYQQLLSWFCSWYQKGYIYPDAAFTDFDTLSLLADDVILTYPMSSSPGLVTSGTYFSGEIVCLRLMEPGMSGTYAKAGFWIIPSTSQAPEAAMRFLNLMLTDPEIGNLISYGIKDRDYVVTDEELGIISYPEGKNEQTVDYYNPMGLYGDYTKLYWRGTKESLLARQKYSEEAAENPFTGIVNFNYSTAKVAAQLELVQNVVVKYTPLLESGSLDLDVYYPEFVQALKDAGVDEVIADKQAQLDAWLDKQEA